MRALITDKRGFSLIELMMVVAISLVIMGAGFIAMRAGTYSSATIDMNVSMQQDVRAALDMMATEIGMASYNPQMKKGSSVWLNTSCAAGGTAANKGIQAATATSITIEMDANSDGTISTANAAVPEVINYSYDQTNQYISRTTNCGGTTDFLGSVNKTTTGLNVLSFAFAYYDSTGAVTANIPDIRRIDIIIQVETTEKERLQIGTGGKRRMYYSTSVLVRNHALSP